MTFLKLFFDLIFSAVQMLLSNVDLVSNRFLVLSVWFNTNTIKLSFEIFANRTQGSIFRSKIFWFFVCYFNFSFVWCVDTDTPLNFLRSARILLKMCYSRCKKISVFAENSAHIQCMDMLFYSKISLTMDSVFRCLYTERWFRICEMYVLCVSVILH